MPHTSRAIGAVTDLLVNQLRALTDVPSVTSGRPEPLPSARGERLNLFLYEATIDGNLRSHALEGRPTPVWLVLRYLVTAYSDTSTDSSAAHRTLGAAIRALHGLGYLPLDELMPDDELALRPNPEPLKLTFVSAGSDLLGRLMQGSDEKYRCSIAIEVRPVMIASSEPSEHALLVGRRYRMAAPTDPPPGVNIALDAAPAPALDRAVPARFEAGTAIRLVGSGFAPGDVARLGPIELPITGSGSAPVVTFSEGSLRTALGPGALPLSVIRTITPPTGRPRRRISEPVPVRLVPTLRSVTRVSVRRTAPGVAEVEIDLSGEMLGRDADDSVVALWSGGRTVASSDAFDAPADDTQTARRVTVGDVPAGTHRVILRVNGSQASDSPELEVRVP